MAVTPVYGWPIPNLTDVADGPDGFSDLALAIEATVTSKSLSTYTPAWTSDTTFQPSNPASRSGWYRIDNGICEYIAQLTFGSSTSGGRGPLNIGLPVPAHNSIQRQICGQALLFVSGIVNWDRRTGYGTTGSSTATLAGLWFEVNNDTNNYGRWENVAESGSAGSGTPAVPSPNSNVRNGGYVMIQGSYFVA